MVLFPDCQQQPSSSCCSNQQEQLCCNSEEFVAKSPRPRWRCGSPLCRTLAAACVLLLAVSLSQQACAARLVTEKKGMAPDTMRAWQSLLQQSDITAFDDAFEATYNGTGAGDVSRTLAQYEEMVSWLIQSPTSAAAQIHELHNYAVRELVYDAVQLANKPFNETDALTVLEYISSRLAQVSSKYGYPVARRVIVGALLKQRVEHGRFSRPVQQLVDKILLQLFQLHKKSTASKGAIQFFHISKSGGTNLCQSAQTNGCNTEGFDERHNCLIKDFGDTPRWVTNTAHKYVEYRLQGTENPKDITKPWYVNFHTARRSEDGCTGRWAYLKQNNWNFYANEYTMPPGEQSLCKQFVNLMMWREPLARLHSQISWIQKLYKGAYADSDISKAFKSRTSGFWERLTPAAVNNYYIRSLLGTRFFEYPIVNINSTHIQWAKIQVLLHDLLLMLENKQFNDITLKIGLGWEFSLQDGQIRSSADIADEISMPIDMDVLEQRNAPDVQVYEFARELQTLDVLLFSFIGQLDSKLGLQNLSTNKCGYVSLDAAK